ncbi:hypothetical protein BpHYR1_031264 [Brachionus plicatilis]|uniref:Uncharacterized protein n=1 Tax=Brachionus plicatilis TaxID=10195 RepID=A0A3M7R0X7_BRAPC|nr:hypothetical protein BpHYR1_031264 [Brachionus plicatilis]
METRSSQKSDKNIFFKNNWVFLRMTLSRSVFRTKSIGPFFSNILLYFLITQRLINKLKSLSV